MAIIRSKKILRSNKVGVPTASEDPQSTPSSFKWPVVQLRSTAQIVSAMKPDYKIQKVYLGKKGVFSFTFQQAVVMAWLRNDDTVRPAECGNRYAFHSTFKSMADKGLIVIAAKKAEIVRNDAGFPVMDNPWKLTGLGKRCLKKLGFDRSKEE